jgi:hypothetical protein
MGTTHSFRLPENTNASLAAFLATPNFKNWPEMMRRKNQSPDCDCALLMNSSAHKWCLFYAA